MRKRNTQLNIRLTEAEMQKLKKNAAKAKYPVSNYVRALINGNSPKECPPIEYHLMMDDLEDCLGSLDRIAKRMPNVFCGNQETIFMEDYIEALNREVFLLYDVVDMIREEMQLPEDAKLKEFPELLEPRMP